MQEYQTWKHEQTLGNTTKYLCMCTLLGTLSQFESLFNHDSNSIKHLVKGSLAHECTGGDQLVFLVNVRFFHICVHVLAAHGLQGVRCLGVRPPDDDN